MHSSLPLIAHITVHSLILALPIKQLSLEFALVCAAALVDGTLHLRRTSLRPETRNRDLQACPQHTGLLHAMVHNRTSETPLSKLDTTRT